MGLDIGLVLGLHYCYTLRDEMQVDRGMPKGDRVLRAIAKEQVTN